MLRRAVVRGSAAIFAASSAALYIEAPQGDHGDGTYSGVRKQQVVPEWFLNIARYPFIFVPAFSSKFYMNVLNKTDVEGLENLLQFVKDRPNNRPLITVSNHSATVDDPALLSTILPSWCFLPKYCRWGTVSQEYSYTKGAFLRFFFFAVKALPLKRGAGTDQPMLEHVFDKVQEGLWVHLFPEGKIEQHLVLGGRSEPRASEIGRLKWGTAKLIARADVRPVVVPIYHTNMEKIMPQDENNKLISMVPKTGVHVTMRVGKPIDFDDLFDKYADCRVVGSQAAWATQDREKEFHSAITKRIEDALLELAEGIYEKP